MSKQITIDAILNEDLFELLGLEGLSDPEKEELLTAMNDTIQARLFLSITEELSPADRTIMDGLNGEELAKFLESREINVFDRLVEEAVKYRLELATIFQATTGQVPVQPPVQSPAA